MAMLTFLLTLAVLSVAIYKGYRFSMSLYARGAMGMPEQQLPRFGEDVQPVQQKQGTSLMLIQDYAMRYARVGLFLLAGLVLLIVIVLATLMFSVF